jgi:hypothetical protein
MSNLKKCKKCGIDKPQKMFYQRRLICKPCFLSDLVEKRKSPKQKNNMQKYIKSKKGKESRKKANKKWNSLNKEKTIVHNKIKDLVYRGIITPKPCVKCGKKAQAHHEDYLKPLEITWLCPKHHGERHREIRMEKQNVNIS